MGLPLDRNELYQEPFSIEREHAQVTGDTTVKLYQVPAGRKLRITRVLYLNVTGLAEDTTNVFAITIVKGDTPVEIALWSTDSDLSATDAGIPANEFLEIPITAAADADAVIDGDGVDGLNELSLFLNEGGMATLPTGFVRVEGYWVA